MFIRDTPACFRPAIRPGLAAIGMAGGFLFPAAAGPADPGSAPSAPRLDATLQVATKGGRVMIPAADADWSAEKPPADPFPRWRLRAEYFQSASNDIGNVFLGDASPIAQNGIAVGAGYVLAKDVCDLPLDLILQGTVMWHDEKGRQDNFLQYTASLRVEWTAFPWNSQLRTRMALASGLSYAEKIPFAEVVTRESRSSRHLLHYLEPSVSLNSGDLFRLMQLDRLFGGFDSSGMDQTWLVARILHRSGAWGTYGEDKLGNSISTGSNFLSLGLEMDF
ncbi:MAG: hypothetical protein HKN82_13760 [Akkermansiaceae bacterium]|nr:hypothetical protein [Akkermansiaceae bacterium]NNM28784.1 hypothetical protein [Akkermansiaceae bacterium]